MVWILPQNNTVLKILIIFCLLREFAFLFSIKCERNKFEVLKGKDCTFEGTIKRVDLNFRRAFLNLERVNSKPISGTALAIKTLSRNAVEEIEACRDTPECKIRGRVVLNSIKSTFWKTTLITWKIKEIHIFLSPENKLRLFLLNSIYKRIRSFTGHADNKSLRIKSFIAGVTIGRKDHHFNAISSRFRTLGISHLAVISGLHFTLVYSAINNIIKILFFFISFIFRRHFNSILIREAISTLLISTYFFILSSSVPVIRAYIMLLFYIAFKFIPARIHPLKPLFIAATAVILIFPTGIFEASFYLSFISVFALISWNMISIKNTPAHRLHFLINLIYPCVIIPVFTLPVSLLFFKSVPLLATGMNMIFIPLTYMLISLTIISLPIPLVTGANPLCYFVEKYLQLVDYFYCKNGIFLRIKTISIIEVLLYIALIFLISFTGIYKNRLSFSLRR